MIKNRQKLLKIIEKLSKNIVLVENDHFTKFVEIHRKWSKLSKIRKKKKWQ